MDSDLPDEDEFLPSEAAESEEDITSRRPSDEFQVTNNDVSTNGDDISNGKIQSSLKSPIETRWDRLKKFYNDDYKNLFLETFDNASEDMTGYDMSQYGAVIWSPEEKVKFFTALERYGERQVQHIATKIGTKSEIEVRAYMILLQQSELDRQLFEVQTKNISKADIPAAIEVDVEYEEGLEQCADALGAYQDRFDQALGERQNDSTIPWLITDKVAMQFDAQAGEAQNQLSDSEDVATNVSEEPETPQSTFKLSTFLELSEKVFMNGSEQKEYEHWSFHAEKGERPCMTSETVEELYELVLNYLRRLIQTTIFLAESRIRSSHTWDHEPAREVRLEDINTMRQILNIEGDLWDYWTRLPRRAQFRVVSGDHRRGYQDKIPLPIDEVEATLSTRHSARRRRSLSTASSSSQSSLSEPEGSEASDTSSVKLNHEGFADPVPLHISLMLPSNQPADGSGRRREPSFDIQIEDYSDEFHDDGEENDDGEEGDHNEEDDTVGDAGAESEHSSASGAEHRLPIKMSSRKRRRVEEEGLEIYLQDLDAYDRVQEEQRLTKLLGIGYPSGPAEIYADHGQRPRARRRLGENVNRWQPEYQAVWEAYDLHKTDKPEAQTEGDEILHQSVE